MVFFIIAARMPHLIKGNAYLGLIIGNFSRAPPLTAPVLQYPLPQTFQRSRFLVIPKIGAPRIGAYRDFQWNFPTNPSPFVADEQERHFRVKACRISSIIFFFFTLFAWYGLCIVWKTLGNLSND